MKKGKTIKIAIAVFLIIVLIAIVSVLMLKYEVEGELNMPFNLSKLMVISSAEGIEKNDTENLWNFELVQNNDIYIEIEKNDNYKKTEVIDKIVLDNFKVNEEPKKGKIYIYKPTQDNSKIYDYSKESIVEGSLEYKGSQKTDIKNLEISNQGGRILLRYAIGDLGNFVSDDMDEIIHNGTILKKANITTEDIKSKISFDLTIELVSGVKYKACISLEIPVDDVIEEGTTNFELTDLKNIVFKRI